MSGGQDPSEVAEKLGLDVVWPAKNELFIDIDEYKDLSVFLENVAILRAEFNIEEVHVVPSRNGGNGKHVTVRVKDHEFDDRERLMLQAMLGSDRKREILALIGVMRGFEANTCFFKKRDEEPEDAAESKGTNGAPAEEPAPLF